MTFKNSHICTKWPEKRPYGNAASDYHEWLYKSYRLLLSSFDYVVITKSDAEKRLRRTNVRDNDELLYSSKYRKTPQNDKRKKMSHTHSAPPQTTKINPNQSFRLESISLFVISNSHVGFSKQANDYVKRMFYTLA